MSRRKNRKSKIVYTKNPYFNFVREAWTSGSSRQQLTAIWNSMSGFDKMKYRNPNRVVKKAFEEFNTFGEFKEEIVSNWLLMINKLLLFI